MSDIFDVDMRVAEVSDGDISQSTGEQDGVRGLVLERGSEE